jgi:hypothetical protein
LIRPPLNAHPARHQGGRSIAFGNAQKTYKEQKTLKAVAFNQSLKVLSA